ncbi:MAG: hypothetical protein DBX55_08560 [Verrucomicrobia bacterium]|nr:MAG: hypothetical protein DBX55_08560 [Verrucomicrobiota bacterium]
MQRAFFYEMRFLGKSAAAVNAAFRQVRHIRKMRRICGAAIEKNSGRLRAGAGRDKKFPLPFFKAAQRISNAHGLQHFANLKSPIKKPQLKDTGYGI